MPRRETTLALVGAMPSSWPHLTAGLVLGWNRDETGVRAGDSLGTLEFYPELGMW